jgi:hypothetical protein
MGGVYSSAEEQDLPGSLVATPFGSAARTVGLDVRVGCKDSWIRCSEAVEGRRNVPCSSGKLKESGPNHLQSLETKRGRAVSSSTICEGPAGSGGTRLVGGSGGVDSRTMAGECHREQRSSEGAIN